MKTLSLSDVYWDITKRIAFSLLLSGVLAFAFLSRVALSADASMDAILKIFELLGNNEVRNGTLKVFYFANILFSPLVILTAIGTVISYKKERILIDRTSVTLSYLKNRTTFQKTIPLKSAHLEKHNIFSIKSTFAISFHDDQGRLIRIPISKEVVNKMNLDEINRGINPIDQR